MVRLASFSLPKRNLVSVVALLLALATVEGAPKTQQRRLQMMQMMQMRPKCPKPKKKKPMTMKPRRPKTQNPVFSLEPIPVNEDDFGEPDWEAILELAFPTWAPPANGCPRLKELGGDFVEGYDVFPTPEDGKFNPCYYTKAFAGLDPKLGGYPTPIDTHYPYEFAAPFMMQPGDGSTHHCQQDAIDIGACPKLGKDCGPDCASITDNYGIGHIPPFGKLVEIEMDNTNVIFPSLCYSSPCCHQECL
mmetsp:Transcript_4917/g.6158  ORF Transcript_4917/g.6158 Transcript_4917/m.6158 type:complete len:247 (-) Transcript_4917:735-1475(-)